jgi:hypothetical protein
MRPILDESRIHPAVRDKVTFVRGVLIGGAQDLERLLKNGELK